MPDNSAATFDVLRDHAGDRFYRRGETRQAVPLDVAHLVALGVLRRAAAPQPEPQPAPHPKPQPKPRSKAMPAAPETK